MQTPRSLQGSMSPLTALTLPGLGSDKAGTPTAAASAANPTLAAAMAGMPLAQMLHMGPGMSGRHPGHPGPPGLSRLGSGLPATPPAPLPSSTTSLSLPGTEPHWVHIYGRASTGDDHCHSKGAPHYCASHCSLLGLHETKSHRA